ncbi:hypothetical protein GR927_35970 [Mycolicibacterium sp. 3033]|nr:hypothetical protein [Mycolicibacterium aurantiacum]
MSNSGKFVPNKAGMAKLQRDLEKKFSAGIQIPLSGSEADAVADVKKQMKNMGLTPNEAEVRKMVRDARS